MSIALFIGSEAADLSKDTVIALTIQVHDLTNLESRDGNYSNSIKLPLTHLNKRLLGFANDVNSYSNIPYTRIEAQLHINGIVQSGFLQLDSIEGDFANVVFFSGNSGFFEAMGDKKLNDLDLSDFDSYWNISGLTPNTFSTKNNTTGVVWGIVEYGTNEIYKTLDNTFTVNPKTLRPCLYVHSIMDKILELTGFEIQGDFLTDSRYLAEIVPITINEPIHSEAWNIDNGANVELLAPVVFNVPILDQDGFIVQFDDIISNTGGNYSQPYYYIPANGIYNTTFNYNVTIIPAVSVDVTLQIMIQRPFSSPAILSSKVFSPNQTGFISAENFDAAEGDFIYCTILAENNDTISSVDVTLDGSFVTEINEATIYYGQLFECTGNMPEMTLKEFVKSLAQRYNLLFKADVVSQVITVLTYDEVYNAEPLDWTDRVDVNSKTVEFHPAFFGQNNQFRWADETNNPEDYANGALNISDEILKKELITIQQPFAASLDVIRFDNVSVSQIPLLEYDSISVSVGSQPAIAEPNQVVISNVTLNVINEINIQKTTIYKLTTVKPRLLYVVNTLMTEELVYDDGVNTAQNSTTEPLTKFWNDNGYNLTFADNENGLIDNYTNLAFSFGRFKKLTVLMKLTAIDALTFAFDRTINISPYGRFYVNKIKDYQPNKLTAVELIKV